MIRERDLASAHAIFTEVGAKIKRLSALGKLGHPHHPAVVAECVKLNVRLAEARLLLMVGPEALQ